MESTGLERTVRKGVAGEDANDEDCEREERLGEE
jgi:hypothetical protein